MTVKDRSTMKKQLLIATTAVTIGLAGIAGVGMASAQGGFGNHDNLVTALANKFSLKTDEVQAVFDEQHTANQAERQAEYQNKLDQAVTDGKLTQEQADLLSTKHAEMTTFMNSLKDKTSEERRDAMQAQREDFRQWCIDNNISARFMAPDKGMGRGMGMRGVDNI